MGIGKIQVVENFPREELSICVLCIRVFTVREFHNCFFRSFRSIFKLLFLSQHKFEFLDQELNLKYNTSRGELRRKTVDFVCRIRILIVQIFPRNRLSNFSRYSNSSSFVTQKYRTQFFYEGPVQKLLSCENILDGMLLTWFFALDFWQSNIRNNANYNDSSRYWNSQFSVTRVLVSSILVSVKVWKLWRSVDKSNQWNFYRIRNLIIQKLRKMLSILIYIGIQCYFCPQLQTSFLPQGRNHTCDICGKWFD